MLIVPFNTDAPSYHYQWGTVALVVVNVVIHLLVGDNEWILCSRETLALQFDGSTPLHWLTHNFAHAHWPHLIGNMVFLWVFGLIVEGKLGWWRFLLVYLAIGMLQGALQQATLVAGEPGEPSGSLGASSCIFGLMVLSLLWAPANHVNVFVLLMLHLRPYFKVMEWDVWFFCAAFILWDLVMALVIGLDRPSTPLLHTYGAAVALPIGLALLLLKWVDCEGWDLISLVRYGKPKLPERPIITTYPSDDPANTGVTLAEERQLGPAAPKVPPTPDVIEVDPATLEQDEEEEEPGIRGDF